MGWITIINCSGDLYEYIGNMWFYWDKSNKRRIINGKFHVSTDQIRNICSSTCVNSLKCKMSIESAWAIVACLIILIFLLFLILVLF